MYLTIALSLEKIVTLWLIFCFLIFLHGIVKFSPKYMCKLIICSDFFSLDTQKTKMFMQNLQNS